VFSVVLAGCSARATVNISVHPDGSGTVRAQIALDADAVQAAEAGGATLDQRVRLADLHRAAWTVSPWVRARNGGATLTVTKRFQSTDQVASIARELSWSTGPLRHIEVTRAGAWLGLGHRSALHGVVDLADAQPGVMNDQQLVASLTGQHVDLNAINQQLLTQLRSSFSVRVVTDLPGLHRVVTVKPGGTAMLGAAVTTIDTTRVLFLVVALTLTALAGLVGWRGGRRRRRGGRRRRRRRGTATVTRGETPPPTRGGA
jgi:hypothetical protein